MLTVQSVFSIPKKINALYCHTAKQQEIEILQMMIRLMRSVVLPLRHGKARRGVYELMIRIMTTAEN